MIKMDLPLLQQPLQHVWLDCAHARQLPLDGTQASARLPVYHGCIVIRSWIRMDSWDTQALWEAHRCVTITTTDPNHTDCFGESYGTEAKEGAENLRMQ